MRIFVLIILFISVFNVYAYMPKFVCSAQQTKAITNTIFHYLDSHDGLKSYQITILFTECVGNFAAAKLHPKQPITDDATIYLKKTNKKWHVLSLGTDFSNEFLKKIPKPLRYQQNTE